LVLWLPDLGLLLPALVLLLPDLGLLLPALVLLLPWLGLPSLGFEHVGCRLVPAFQVSNLHSLRASSC